MTTATLGDLRSAARATRAGRHLIVPRAIAGVPLLAIGLMHVVAEGYGMRPIVEAAGLPAAALLAPLAVALEIVAAVSPLLGAWARAGALRALPAMAVAAYTHLAISEWPNAGGEPPLALPLIVFAAAAYVLWRGGGRWSVDARRTAR